MPNISAAAPSSIPKPILEPRVASRMKTGPCIRLVAGASTEETSIPAAAAMGNSHLRFCGRIALRGALLIPLPNRVRSRGTWDRTNDAQPGSGEAAWPCAPDTHAIKSASISVCSGLNKDIVSLPKRLGAKCRELDVRHEHNLLADGAHVDAGDGFAIGGRRVRTSVAL